MVLQEVRGKRKEGKDTRREGEREGKREGMRKAITLRSSLLSSSEKPRTMIESWKSKSLT